MTKLHLLFIILFIACLAGVAIGWIYIWTTIPGAFLMGTMKGGISIFELSYLIRHGAGKALIWIGCFTAGAVGTAFGVVKTE